MKIVDAFKAIGRAIKNRARDKKNTEEIKIPEIEREEPKKAAESQKEIKTVQTCIAEENEIEQEEQTTDAENKKPDRVLTPAQEKKMRLWAEYYREKQRMTNNERRRRKTAMARRPKRQQWITKKGVERCSRKNRKH